MSYAIKCNLNENVADSYIRSCFYDNVWPNKLTCKPIAGEYVQGSGGMRLKILYIVHTKDTMILELTE